MNEKIRITAANEYYSQIELSISANDHFMVFEKLKNIAMQSNEKSWLSEISAIESSYNNYNQQVVRGMIDFSQQQQELAKINNRLFILINYMRQDKPFGVDNKSSSKSKKWWWWLATVVLLISLVAYVASFFQPGTKIKVISEQPVKGGPPGATEIRETNFEKSVVPLAMQEYVGTWTNTNLDSYNISQVIILNHGGGLLKIILEKRHGAAGNSENSSISLNGRIKADTIALNFNHLGNEFQSVFSLRNGQLKLKTRQLSPSQADYLTEYFNKQER